MLGLITGRIKTFVIAALALLMPILFVVGRSSGKQSEKDKILREELEASQKKNTFYKALSEHEKDHTIDTRDGLINRLRGKGL